MSDPFDVPYGQVMVGSIQNKTLESSGSSEQLNEFNVHRGLIDTAAPFESVKEAVTKFGGIVDWKAHNAMAVEKSKHIQIELKKVQKEIPKYKKQSETAQDAKAQVLEELDSTKRLIEELKHSLEKIETEEAQAKQDSELAQLRVKEMEQGITDDASVAAKAQVKVAKARHEAAVEELKSVKEELAALQGDYTRLVMETELAITKAAEAVSASKDVEKKVEDLTLELLTTKEALESAHASHLEAEEHRIGMALSKDQDSLNWEKELEQAEGEVQHLNDQLLVAKDLKSKLDTASTLLVNMKAELATYVEGKTQTSIQSVLASAKELEKVTTSIEKTKDEVDCLRVAASSLKAELDRETEVLSTLRQREGMTYITVSSLEAELSRMQSELELVLTKEREAREKMEELPKVLQQEAQDTDQAKSVANLACEELRKAKEEAEQAKASASTMEVRLLATLKEIEAAKASEKLALEAIKAMQESKEQLAAVVTNGADAEAPPSSNGVTLPLEEYYTLSKSAYEAEELANQRVISAVEQIKEAKKSELKNLEILEAAYKEMEEKKEALRVAMEMAEKANEGKLGVEQELRDWRAEHEQRRRVSDAAAAQLPENPSRCPSGTFEERGEPKSFVNGEASLRINSMLDQEIYRDNAVPELKPRKKSFFPRIVMFLARKKAQSLK